jgi:predicted dienelactone hydrolase
MTWIRRMLALVLAMLAAVTIYAVATALRTTHPVGFQTTQLTDTDGTPFTLAIWYPTRPPAWPTTFAGSSGLMQVAVNAPVAGDHLPLVVISHGNGGGPLSHVDLALALADAGYVVAAPMHPGDNYADQHAAGSPHFFANRTTQLHRVVDSMLQQWVDHGHLDPSRIGAFGFSAGGTTVLADVGAQPDLRLIPPHCAAVHEFICDVLRLTHSPVLQGGVDGGVFEADPRIKAAVVAAPGFGFTMVPDGLSKVHVPLQLWSGSQDDRAPYVTNAGLIRKALTGDVEFHDVPGAGHFSFLAPCGLLRPPSICVDPAGFDRAAFHLAMDAQVVAFFNKHLASNLATPSGA